MTAKPSWPHAWAAQWIWDRVPAPLPWWSRPAERPASAVYLRTSVTVDNVPDEVPIRVTCDSRYVLHVNGECVARGPVREDPSHLGWDVVDVAHLLRRGRNSIVVLCRYYGAAGPWWSPATPSGTLGSGSFCLESHPDSPVRVSTDAGWLARSAPWLPSRATSWFGLPSEIVDNRQVPTDLHAADPDPKGWAPAVVLAAGLGTVQDRPPAAPYTVPTRRPVPQLGGPARPAIPLDAWPCSNVDPAPDPADTWQDARADEAIESGRQVTVFDLGLLSLGHLTLHAEGATQHSGAAVDLTAGEHLRDDGLPDPGPRRWAARLVLAGRGSEEVTFFDPVGARFMAVQHPSDVRVTVTMSEALCPRVEGASFEASDPDLTALWRTGLRTVELCSTDAFIDCPGREQRAWVGDAYLSALVWLVTSPDPSLVLHTLELAAHSRRPDGLLAMAAGCDLSRSPATIPDYSLLWIRTLAAYWRHTGDLEGVSALLSTATGIVQRYESYRGTSGLLEDVPGWVFLDWAQVERGRVTGTHDGLYALALHDYASLPGSDDVSRLLAHTRAGFEQLWDPGRRVYVDSRDGSGEIGQVSQHTNAAALAAGIVPTERRTDVLAWITDPAAHGGRLVATMATPDTDTQTRRPSGFSRRADVVACEPMFARILHEAMAACGRLDLVVGSHRRWLPFIDTGTFPELWSGSEAGVSACHGWSATPTYDLTTYVLGVTPTEPGFRRAEVTPYLGHLQHVAGRVPTPRGWLTVDASRSRVAIEVPAGVTVSVGGRVLEMGRHSIAGDFTGQTTNMSAKSSADRHEGAHRV